MGTIFAGKLLDYEWLLLYIACMSLCKHDPTACCSDEGS